MELAKPRLAEDCALDGPATGAEGALPDSYTSLTPQVTHPAGQVWTNMNTGEVAPDVMTPATWGLVAAQLMVPVHRLLQELGIDPQAHPVGGLLAGRLYFNLTTLLGLLRALPFFRRIDPDRFFGGLHGELKQAGALEALEQNVPRYRLSPWKALGQLVKVAIWFLGRNFGRGWVRLELEERNMDAKLGKQAAQSPSLGALRQLNGNLTSSYVDLIGYAAVGMSYFSRLEQLCERWLGSKTVVNELLMGQGGMASAEPVKELWELTRYVAGEPWLRQVIEEEVQFERVRMRLQDGEPGRTFLQQWQNFMDRHGHHSQGEVEIFNPRWAEQPDLMLQHLRGNLEMLHTLDPMLGLAGRMRARDARLRAIKTRLGPLRWRYLQRVLRRAGEGVLYRERLKNMAVKGLYGTRLVRLEVGRRAVAQGILEVADDIFFLYQEEVESLMAGEAREPWKPLVARRRAAYAHFQTVMPPHVVVGSLDPAQLVPVGHTVRPANPPDRLEGLPVSPGVVEGRARVLLRAADDLVQPGEILVAPYTDPGWTLHFLNASAIVMDMGGLLSHGSIVAREYGIPAVVNVGLGTATLRTGDLIRVDGEKGTVEVLKRAD